MSRRFNEEEQEILFTLSCNITEEFEDLRKGVAQTFYVFEIKADDTFCSAENDYEETEVSEEYVGFWKMKYADNLRHYAFRDCLRDYDWVRCVKREVVTVEWEEV